MPQNRFLVPHSPLSLRDPMQLDLASVSSIQVVGVVEALIQNADTIFPGGRARFLLGRGCGPERREEKGKGAFFHPQEEGSGGLLWFPSVGSRGEALHNKHSWGLLFSLHPEVDFNVSGMFTPPANIRCDEAAQVEEPSPVPPPASTPALPDGEV